MASPPGGLLRPRFGHLIALSFALAASLAFTISAAAVNVSPLDPAGPNAERINFLYTVIFWTAVVVTVVVGGLIIYAAFRFRRRDDQEPAQFHSHTALEITWSVVPFIILAVLFGLTVVNMPFIRNGPQASMTIKVIGRQYAWQYDYGNGVRVGTMHVPVGENIRLEIVSTDVNHSFWVPRLAGKTDAIPGQTNYSWFRADAPGVYDGQCTEFCGLNHALMLVKVEATTRAEFDRWMQGKLREVRATASPTPTR